MANTAVDYTVTVRKTGTGATEAVNDFNAVAAAAAKTNAALAVNTTAITAAGAATKTATATFKAMHGTLTLIGIQAFPQLTMAAMAAHEAIVGVKTAAAATGVGLTAMAGGLAVVAASAYAAVKALTAFFEMRSAQKAEAASGTALAGSNDATAAAFIENVRKKTEAGRLHLSDAENDELAGLLSNNQFGQARNFIQGRLPMGDLMTEGEQQKEVSSRFQDFNRQMASSSAYAQFNTPGYGSDVELQKQNAIFKYKEEMALLNKMRADGLLSEKEMDAFTMEADTRRVESLVQLRGHLTELQELGKSVAETFASGLSGAIVKAFSEGGKAFKEFASNFLAQIGQMIMQMVILKAISGIFGSAVGAPAGGLGGMAFANGGVTFAANGLAGVRSVSSPTYFPRFNVVAGEAGREMMTVLARPRMMEVGGMQAVVGSAQGRQLAITSASDLARGGAGGTIVIQVMGTPDFEARVVSNSVKGAVVQVASDMRQDSPISRGVKGLTA